MKKKTMYTHNILTWQEDIMLKAMQSWKVTLLIPLDDHSSRIPAVIQQWFPPLYLTLERDSKARSSVDSELWITL